MKPYASSSVLTSVSIAGVVGTSLVTVICHEKAKQSWPDAPTTAKERFKKTWKHYIPAATVGLATIGCIVANQRMSSRKIAALTATCAYLVKNRENIEKKVSETIGEEKYKEIKKKVSSIVFEQPISKQSIEDTGNGDIRFFEGYSGRMFYSSKDAVEGAVKVLNKRFEEGEYLSLNDFYELLGIEKTHFGNQFGWAANSDYYDAPIDIAVTYETDDRGQEYGIIEIFTYPMECYMEV